MSYQSRQAALNTKQRQAVTNTEGPLLVLAGPGTGKTELLSMRTAHILTATDTPPESILCLTFTDSGATAMRERLVGIIGSDAYRIAIHTFHSFGAEIINQNAEYFYHGASARAMDELRQYELLSSILDELPYDNVLASKNGGEYTYLKDVRSAISDLKRSGLTSDELRMILDDNERVMDAIERDIQRVFQAKITKAVIDPFSELARQAADISVGDLPVAATPYTEVLALSMAHAASEAIESQSTKPITTWKNAWLAKDADGNAVFKDRAAGQKLRALAHVYGDYLARASDAALYDYDDMILNVIHALETNPGLAATIREKYLYIMVDEFQDTNLAQLRILFDMTADQDAPNIMAVGDDDQGIYGFQGAEISNVQRFREHFDDPDIIVLTDNYRSSSEILSVAREVITQGEHRLESKLDGLTKALTSHSAAGPDPVLVAYQSPDAERAGVASEIASLIRSGTEPGNIVVLARRHTELVELVPFLAAESITVAYEKRDNILDQPLIILLERLLHVIKALHSNDHQIADALLPEIMAHPAFDFAPLTLWQLSLRAARSHSTWLETMQLTPELKPFAEWLIELGVTLSNHSFETILSTLLGMPDVERVTVTDYTSPLFDYFFSADVLQESPANYLGTLEALRTIRDKLTTHIVDHAPSPQDFLEFVAMHRELGAGITTIRSAPETDASSIHLMTAHAAKGLEFKHVFLVGLTDKQWGSAARGSSSKLAYPKNLTIRPDGSSYDERLRLAYVAMTRAKETLHMSYSCADDKAKEMLPASFIAHLDPRQAAPVTTEEHVAEVTTAWYRRLAAPRSDEMQSLLGPTLERYQLSSTHLTNFLDVTKGGPEYFLLTNLLRFPTAKSPHAAYGTAMHATLQHAHDFIRAHNERQAHEDIVADFERQLSDTHLAPSDHEVFLQRGVDALSAFLEAQYGSFTSTQRTEINFASQGVHINGAHLAGKLDLLDIDDQSKTIRVTDYKTGKPSMSWTGKTPYEKIKLHHYRQQLMFYQLLIENSRDYRHYQFENGVVQFVEPASNGAVVALDLTFTRSELDEFSHLISALWRAIQTFDFPDTSEFEPTINGIKAFEQAMIDKYSDI